MVTILRQNIVQYCTWYNHSMLIRYNTYRHTYNPPKLKVPAHSDSVKRWNFRKTAWKRFCLLKDESVERSPPPDTSNIERSYQDFCESRLSATKQCKYLAAGKSMCHAGTKSVRPSVAPLPEPQLGLTLMEPLRPYYPGSGRRSRSDGRKQ